MSHRPRFKHPGKYLRELGEGAFGYVCLVEMEDGQKRALKYGYDESIKDEGRIYKSIGSHPHILQLIDSGESPDGCYWLLLELYEGTLASYSRNPSEKTKYLAPALVLKHVVKALTHIHSQGIVHNDVHADNFGVIWDAPDRPRVVAADLGAAVRFRHPTKGWLLDTDRCPGQDLDTWFRFAEKLSFSPWTWEPEQAIKQELIDLRSSAVSKGRFLTAHYLMTLLPDDLTWMLTMSQWAPPQMLRLIVAMEAQRTGRTMASVCRGVLENTGFLRGVSRGDFMLNLCDLAGVLDNPEYPRIFTPEMVSKWDTKPSRLDPLIR